MPRYDTDTMHKVATTLQNNAEQLQTQLQSFWSAYQSSLQGTLPAFETCLSAFMTLSQHPLELLTQNRTDLGVKLGQAATAVEHEEKVLQNRFVRIE
jgi:hypothetical protein